MENYETVILYSVFRIRDQKMNIWKVELELEDVKKLIKNKKLQVDWDLAIKLNNQLGIYLTGRNSNQYDILHLDKKHCIITKTITVK